MKTIYMTTVLDLVPNMAVLATGIRARTRDDHRPRCYSPDVTFTTWRVRRFHWERL